MRTIIALLCVVSCAAVLVGGCSTAGSGPVIPAGPEFRERTSPENVVYNLELAYDEMDLEEYLDCLSEDFEFFPTEDDVNDPNQAIPPVWYKTDEAVMHANMFADTSAVENITLTLTISTIVYDDGLPGDPLDNTCVCVVDVDLRVILLDGNGFLATSPSEFRMRVDTENELPWDIYMWYDGGDSRRGAEEGCTEESTWGGVKALYW